MNDPLYRKDLLRLAADAHGAGRLAAPDATGDAFNPACGDRVRVGVSLVGGCIAEIAHETRACILAQASASILGRSLKGATLADVERLLKEVASMLQSNAPSPPPPFETYSIFAGAVEYQNRHRCILLPIEAVLDALERSSIHRKST
ncbi:MAG: iron-sulfur cluster assembly scaffold protein [Rhizomicrobium sp.]